MGLLYHATGAYDENSVDVIQSSNKGVYAREEIELFIGKKIACIDLGFNTVLIFSETAQFFQCSFNAVATKSLYINTKSDCAIYGDAILLDYAEMDSSLHVLMGETIHE